jgi:hypothetical protein
MQSRIIRFGTAIGVAVAAILFLTIPLTFAASTPGSAAITSPALERDIAEPQITSFFRISVPFTIDAELNLSQNGRVIEVAGPSECGDIGGESYRVRVTVTQDATHARARSHFSGPFDCGITGAPLRWEADARAQGPRAFSEGPADVCAMALVHVPGSGTEVRQWCREVRLQK